MGKGEAWVGKTVCWDFQGVSIDILTIFYEASGGGEARSLFYGANQMCGVFGKMSFLLTAKPLLKNAAYAANRLVWRQG